MKIEYITTIDEIIDTQLLWLRGTNIYAQWIAWGIFFWVLIIFLIAYFSTGPLINKLFAGLLLGGFVGGSLIFNHKSMIRKKLKKVLVKKLGSEEPIPAKIILANDKIEYSSNYSSTSFMLEGLEKIEELSNGLVLNFSKGGLFYIPNTAFGSQVEQKKWKEALYGKFDTIT